jgi:glycosyltransferase involved in cell wall biosynthesis
MLRAAAANWHLITCEYAPQLGGVADFTRTVAAALASTGRSVHVWSPAPAAPDDGMAVHELESGYRVSALAKLDRALDACPAPRRLFVQWVPHGYGYKSLNVPFCLWVRRRARAGDEVHLMVHEPFLPFDSRRVRQNVGALAHRVMLGILLRSAHHVWVSTPSFLADVRRFTPTDAPPVSWLPVPSPVPVVDDTRAVTELRTMLASHRPVVGHFGTCHALVAPMLQHVVERLHAERPELRFILIGRGTDAFVERLYAAGRTAEHAIVATGERDARDISLLLQCCDVFVQPYHDGVSARRTTMMALLEHGRPAVTSRGSRTEPYWSDSEAVVTTRGVDGEALASAALELFDQPDRRVALGERARALYTTRFDVTRTLGTLLDAAPV